LGHLYYFTRNVRLRVNKNPSLYLNHFEMVQQAVQPSRLMGHTTLDTHTHSLTHTHTPCRTPLHKWSAGRRSRYLHKKHKKRTSMP